jgi:MFS family permease
MGQRRIVLTFALLTGLLASGYGVMFTVLDDYRDKYGLTGGQLGLIVATGFFTSFAAQVLLAPMADRGHARTLAVTGLALSVVGLVGMAYGTTLVTLLAARLVMGTGAGMATPAARRIVILADPDHLGQNLGRLLAWDVGGFAAGPAVSAVLVPAFGLAAPFLAIGAITVVCVPVVARTHVAETAEPPHERFAFDLLRNRVFAGAVVQGLTVFMMIGTFDALWVLVLSDLRAADWIANIGITLFALPLVVFGPTGGRLAQRLGPFRTGTVGLLLGALFMFLYGQMPSGAAMLAVGVVHAFSDGFTVSSTGVAVGMVAPPARQAGAQGILGGMQTLTGGLTATVAGQLYQHQGRTVAYGLTAVAMVALALTGAVLARSMWRVRPTAGVDTAAVDAASTLAPG